MTMTLAQLWQIVADAKNDLHVVEQQLAKLVDEEEKHKDEPPVYENSLPVGTALITHEDHEKAPIGTLIREYDAVDDTYGAWSWRKIGQDEWAEYDPSGSRFAPISTADVTQVVSFLTNAVVDS